MRNSFFKNSYFAIAGMFYILSAWDLLFHGKPVDIVFLGLGITFTCLGLILKKKGQ